MPPAYLKPYVKRQKNHATNAEAICEVVTRAIVRFIATKIHATRPFQSNWFCSSRPCYGISSSNDTIRFQLRFHVA